MRFALLIALGFIGLEVTSYAIHRWIFHGFLWEVHKTHHLPAKGSFELNDMFTFLFGSLSVLLMVFADRPIIASIAFPIGLGIAIYGTAYFLIHDLYIHRRLLPFASGNALLLSIRAAHQHHHRTVTKKGEEPFGLLMFDPVKFWKRDSRRSGVS